MAHKKYSDFFNTVYDSAEYAVFSYIQTGKRKGMGIYKNMVDRKLKNVLDINGTVEHRFLLVWDKHHRTEIIKRLELLGEKGVLTDIIAVYHSGVSVTLCMHPSIVEAPYETCTCICAALGMDQPRGNKSTLIEKHKNQLANGFSLATMEEGKKSGAYEWLTAMGIVWELGASAYNDSAKYRYLR